MLVDFGQDGNYTETLGARMGHRGITTAQLARATGITQPQLSRWFTTDAQPSVANIWKIETAMRTLRGTPKQPLAVAP